MIWEMMRRGWRLCQARTREESINSVSIKLINKMATLHIPRRKGNALVTSIDLYVKNHKEISRHIFTYSRPVKPKTSFIREQGRDVAIYLVTSYGVYVATMGSSWQLRALHVQISNSTIFLPYLPFKRHVNPVITM